MGLTHTSSGKNLLHQINELKNKNPNQKIIALAGNPNVGKSTLFNQITGMHQHTGNWPGKTVSFAIGNAIHQNNEYLFVDLPGCYSLKSHSPEEEVAADFIKSRTADITVIICDAAALERNLNLALQIKEITDNVVICVNLMDEAKKKNVNVNLTTLSKELDCPAIGTVAYKKESLHTLFDTIENFTCAPQNNPTLYYPQYIESEIDRLSTTINGTLTEKRFRAIEMIEKAMPYTSDDISDAISKRAAEISSKAIESSKQSNRDLKIDKIVTSKFFGFFIIFLLLVTVFWITITGANYPSEILGRFFNSTESIIYDFLKSINLPKPLCEMLVYGIYRVLTWIISVMLPPMAIFFPFFTLLEDIGFLPRIAFNLDKCFNKCSTCGKQALTMCMGFGCNAAGVVGCRIIDTQREQMIAILTNSLVPCNGRFPTVTAIISMFFVAKTFGIFSGIMPAIILSGFIILSVFATLSVSKILSKTLLRGLPSSFTLELPPYRKPMLGKIIVRSVFDRTLFVLGRAVCVAAPAGLIIWLASNITIGNTAILYYVSDFLDPLGKIMGLDGIIITAFILGFPANEIVFPLILMMYTSGNVLTEVNDLQAIKQILISNGWTVTTALNTIIFMLFHWPCSTTCLTVKAETKSLKWTLIAIILPTLCGIALCTLINFII